MENRLEKKIVIDNRLEYPDFINFLFPQFNKSFPTRTINNIYFDYPDLQIYKDNIEGYNQRYKIRIRWYGQNYETAVLEIKIKEFNFGKKLIFPLQGFDLKINLNNYFKQIFDKKLVPIEYLPLIFDLIPSSFNSYDRDYFESLDKKIRITCDRNLRFRKLYNFKLPKIDSIVFTDKTIIEIKYESNQELIVSNLLKHSPFRVTKFSKYTYGVLNN